MIFSKIKSASILCGEYRSSQFNLIAVLQLDGGCAAAQEGDALPFKINVIRNLEIEYNIRHYRMKLTVFSLRPMTAALRNLALVVSLAMVEALIKETL